MRIGIDIDGVLTNVEEFEIDYGSKYFYENKNLDKIIHNLDFAKEYYNLGRELSNQFWSNAIDDYVKLKPRNFAAEVIQKLKDDGNTMSNLINLSSHLFPH